MIQALCRGFFYVGFLILTLAMYYIATQSVLILKNVAFNQYAMERNSFDLAILPDNIVSAYAGFFRAVSTGEYGLIPTLFSRRIHLLCFAASGLLLLIFFLVKKTDPVRILFILALVLIFPLAVNCIYLYYAGCRHPYTGSLWFHGCLCSSDRHWRSMHPGNSRKKHMVQLRHIALNCLLLGLSVIIICNTYFANEAYLGLHLQYENTYAFYTSLISDIRMNPEFDKNAKLAVIGDWKYPDYFFRKFDYTYHLFGHLCATPSEYSMDRFLAYYIGFEIPFASAKETAKIQNSAEFLQMSVYPYYGSIRMIGDTLVVKLSE